MNAKRAHFFLLSCLLLLQGSCTRKRGEEVDDKPLKRTHRFTIGKETTYVDGPLAKDGLIDYETAYNQIVCKGITAKTNAVIHLVQAFGPRPDGREMPPAYFKALGIEAPPDRGKYFVGFTEFVKNKRKDNPELDRELLYNQQFETTQRTWKAAKFPLVQECVAMNEPALALAVGASKQPAYYNPLFAPKKSNDTGGLYQANLAVPQQCRELVSLLASRALLRAGEKKFDEAWQDLMACHRLAALIGSKGTLIEMLVGVALSSIACDATRAFLEETTYSAEKIIQCLKELQQLKPRAPMADTIDVGERFVFLDMVIFLKRYGLDDWEGRESIPPKTVNKKGLEAVDRLDWDPILRKGNCWYDRLATALRIEDHPARRKKLDELASEMRKLDKLFKSKNVRKAIAAGKVDKEVVELIGDMLVAMNGSSHLRVAQSVERVYQVRRNLDIAFALAAHRREHGKYPAKLDDLAPKYIPKVPNDLFSDKPLIYRPDDKGYLLYSVGVDGKDDGGNGPDDDPSGDDLRVRMPLPELKPRKVSMSASQRKLRVEKGEQGESAAMDVDRDFDELAKLCATSDPADEEKLDIALREAKHQAKDHVRRRMGLGSVNSSRNPRQ